MSALILEAKNIQKSFGGNHVVNGVDLALRRSELIALVGPNGAGKTSTLNLLSGQNVLDGGSIRLDDVDVTIARPSHASRRTLFRSFQNGGTFSKLTCVENVAIAGIVRGMSRKQAEKEAFEALKSVGLEPVAHWPAQNLSGGQRKLIDFARLILAEPSVALLDEPTAGVNPAIMQVMRDIIESMRESGTAFIVISHDLPWVFELCQRVVVLASGKVLCSGSPEEVRANKEVQEAYLA